MVTLEPLLWLLSSVVDCEFHLRFAAIASGQVRVHDTVFHETSAEIPCDSQIGLSAVQDLLQSDLDCSF